MRQTILLVMMLVAVLAVSACTTGKGPNVGDTYLGGTEGLKITYAADAPPDMVADNKQESFDVIVQITNKGETAVAENDAKITISGIPPESFGKSKTDFLINPDEAIDKRIKNPDGTVIEPPLVEAIVPNLQYQYAEPGNIQFERVRAEICYLYETNVSAKLCVLEKMTQPEDDDVCVINENKGFSSSGAPVQVTKIQQSGGGRDSTRFTFTIANVDTGAIYKQSTSCDPITQEENKVWVEITGLTDRNGGASTVRCTGLRDGTSEANGYVAMTGGTPRDVSCTVTFPEAQRTDREQPFNIRLKYNYKEFIDKPLLIQYTPV